MRRFYRKRLMLALLALHCSMFHLPYSTCFAQFNTDRLVVIGRNALYYEDYVLSMQYFNQAISAKPYLYEPWFYRGVAKYYLDDYAGAEKDCTSLASTSCADCDASSRRTMTGRSATITPL